MLESVPISSGGQQAYPHHRLHSAEDPHEKAPPGAGLSSLRGLPKCELTANPPTPYHKKPRPGSGAKFGRSIVMGLPGRWQTHPLNTEPNRWFLCRKSQHEKSPAEAGLGHISGLAEWQTHQLNGAADGWLQQPAGLQKKAPPKRG